MIDRAILQIAMQLNEFLRGLLDTSEDIVIVSNLLGPDGAIAPNVNNRIVLFLTSIEKDTASGPRAIAAASGFADAKPVFLNLYLMVAANFMGPNYPEALKFLALVVGFFNRNAVLDHATSPELDAGIDKLVLDIENTSLQAMSNIWGVLGGRYVPSVLYRVRMVPVGGGEIQGRVPQVTEPGATAAWRPQAPTGARP